MMAESHRLGRLQMRETGHNRIGMGFGFIYQDAHKGMNLGADMVERVTHIKPKIGRHLVIARARRMQPPGCLTDNLSQPCLNIHMNIFKRARKIKCAGINFRFDLV